MKTRIYAAPAVKGLRKNYVVVHMVNTCMVKHVIYIILCYVNDTS